MKLNLSVIIFVTIFVSTTSRISRQKQCNNLNEYRCVDGRQCVNKKRWCDGKNDCSDQSDEYFCDGTKNCMPGYFKCGDGKCLPNSARCDQLKDCKDGLDEKGCIVPIAERESVAPETEYTTGIVTHYTTSIINAVEKAKKYLLAKRHLDYGWGSSVSTSRAMVALAFSERVASLDEDEKNLMLKQLNIQLSLDLMTHPRKINLSHLALYINALCATCQDPRNFQGKNLVNLLRIETSKVINSNFSVPLVMLTLCLAEETIHEDVRALTRMYNNENDQAGYRALVVMALICLGKESVKSGYEEYFRDFNFKMSGLEGGNLDVYTKALTIQASNALGQTPPQQRLTDDQLKDGSFGDLLATYYAIPALLNTSLVDLKCKRSDKDKGIMDGILADSSSQSKKVSYSLRITDGSGSVNRHSTDVYYKGNKTFYDVMIIAQSKDPMFKFMYDKTNKGKKVFSLAGIPNDVESGMSWALYLASSDRISTNADKTLQKVASGIDKIFPDDKSHFVFWLKRN